uniref:Band 4.1-like protein 3 n=1 Tax=Schistosoma haematobium TaxID=6185 RepID=A0A094ZL45_SCHHA
MTSLTEKFISSFRTCGLKSCASTSRPGSTHAYVKNVYKPLTLIYQAYLGIKYYPPDPTIIADEQTRFGYSFYYCRLTDCGDYGADRLGSNYVKQLLKLPNLNEQLEKRIKIKHEDCRCRQPALVEYQLLDKVKQLSTYGQIKFHIKRLWFKQYRSSRKEGEGYSSNLPQITGFSHKHKQILIKILNEGTRFTYRCSVDNSETCNSLLETCKNYLNFYRNEISQRIINEPHQSLVNGDLCSNSTAQPICYTNSSLDKTESPFIGNESSLLPESNNPIHVTDPVQPVAIVDETNNCKSNRNPRPLYSSLIEFNPGYLVKSPVPPNINTIHDSKCTTDSCDFHHQHHPTSHYYFDTNVNDSYYNHYYHPTAIPINPYHVRGTSGVFYRPRGCETVTDIGDHPHIYANRRSHCPKYNHARLIMNDPNEIKFKHRRRSFPKTKHYFIEEDFSEDQFLQKHSSLCPTLHTDNCQFSQCRSNSVARSSAYREFHQLDTILPITTSSFKASPHGRAATSRVPRRSHRILPRPVSRLDRYPERCSSPVTTDDSQDTIENHERHDANNLHEVEIKNHNNINNNHVFPKISSKPVTNKEDKCKVNHALVASVAQASTLNNSPNRNKLDKETHELIQIRSNEQGMQHIACNSPRDCLINSSK